MSFLPYLGDLASIIGAFTSSAQQSQSYNSIEQLIQSIFGNQSNIENRMLGEIGGLQGEANQYTSLLPGLTQDYQQELSGTGAPGTIPGASSQYLRDAMSPEALAQLTGINAGGITGNALGYLGNFGGTNVGKITPGQLSTLGNANTNLAGVTPGTEAFYANQMQQGINPQTAQNAQNQLQQQYQQSLSTLNANLAPGQNPGAAQQALQNQLLSSSANLGGQLAGESQQLMGAGAQGLQGAASGLDQETMQRLAQQFGVAQASDAQQQNMLTTAAQLANAYNQTVLGNQQAGATFGQNELEQFGNFVGQGNQINEFNTGALGNIYSQLGQQGEYFSGLASSMPQGNIWSSLGQIFSGQNFGGSSGGPPTGNGTGYVGADGTPDSTMGGWPGFQFGDVGDFAAPASGYGALNTFPGYQESEQPPGGWGNYFSGFGSGFGYAPGGGW